MTQAGDERTCRSPWPPTVTAFDRARVIGALKAAFGQGRLTEDEFDARADQASAAQTHDDLAALIADLPAGSAAVRPPTAKDARIGVLVILIAASVLGVLVLCQFDNILAVLTGFCGCRHLGRGLARDRGPDVRRTASKAVSRAATVAAAPQRRG